jgi:hypothetical protein
LKVAGGLSQRDSFGRRVGEGKSEACLPKRFQHADCLIILIVVSDVNDYFSGKERSKK